MPDLPLIERHPPLYRRDGDACYTCSVHIHLPVTRDRMDDHLRVVHALSAVAAGHVLRQAPWAQPFSEVAHG